MALVKCPECGRENVSDTAIACPCCGFNVREYYEMKIKQEQIKEKKKLEEEINLVRIEKISSETQRRKEKLFLKRSKLIIGGVCILAIAGMILVGINYKKYRNSNKYLYKKAQAEYKEGNYQEALKIYSTIRNYLDSADKINDATIQIAINEYENKCYVSAYNTLIGYKVNEEYFDKVSEYANNCIAEGYDDILEEAIKLYNNGELMTSSIYLKDLISYKYSDKANQYMEYCDFWNEIQGEWNDFYDNTTVVYIDSMDILVKKELNNFTEGAVIPSGLYKGTLETDNGSYGKNLDGSEDLHMNYQIRLDNDYIITFSGDDQDTSKSEGRLIVGSGYSNGENIYARAHYVLNSLVYKDSHPYSKEKEKNEPQIGMTSDEVRKSTWGNPIEINKTTFSWGVKEQWCYSNYRYIYLEDGKVTAISE